MNTVRLLLVFLATLGVSATALGQLPESLLSNLKPRAIGPAVFGGRMVDLAVYEEDPAIFYAASASGGLLKTVNAGNTWENVFDRQSTVSMGAIAIDASNPNVIWVGTGEANNRQSSSWGDGVYKSVDGGKSWKHMGLSDTHHIGRIVVNPQDPNIVFVAALGHQWGPNRERGAFMTTDGGLSWQHVLSLNDDTGVNDIIMDPSDPKVLYASTYQRRRSGWGFNGGGPHSALYKSVDGGKTWYKLTNGIPEGDKGRMGFDIYRKDPNIVYAVVAHREGGIFRSTNKGESWTKMNSLMPTPTYYGKIRIDPNDEKRIYVLGDDLYMSDDGGKTFRDIAAEVHPDHHALWVNPRNSRHVIVATDGGVWVSHDRAATWEQLNNYPTGQFYHISVDTQRPYWIYGGTQDNRTVAGPSAVRDRIGIRHSDWVQMMGGDGMYTVVDLSNPNTVYYNGQYGRIVRYDRKTGERQLVMPQPAPGEPQLRWNWTAPIVVSAHDPKTIYTGANMVFKSGNRGHTWTVISPDLTTQTNRDTLKLMGVLHKDITLYRDQGIYWFGTITALAESPKRAGLMYAGTDDGNVHVTKDGRNWTNLTSRIPGVPQMLVVSRLTPSAFHEGTVYASFDGHRSDDFKPYVYVSPDFGQTWRSISANLPSDGPVRTIKEDPKNPNLLFVGTEFGVFISIDRGASWTRWTTLPTVAIAELVVHLRDNDLVLGTHGRSVLIVDDISPIQQLNPTILSSNTHLFDIRAATQFIPNDNSGFVGGRDFAAPNPEFGAYINYYLKAPVNNAKITIADAGGAVARELLGPTQAGIHRVVWDLRTANSGPSVLPGEYRVTLSAGGQEQTKTVRVHGDALATISVADRKKLFDALITATAMQSTADAAVTAINQLSQQLRQVAEMSKGSANVPVAVKTAVENISKKVADFRLKLVGGGGRVGSFRFDFSGEGQPPEPLRNSIRRLKGELSNSQSPPTAIQSAQLENDRAELNQLVAEVNSTINTTLPNLYAQLAENGIRPSAAEPIKPIKQVMR